MHEYDEPNQHFDMPGYVHSHSTQVNDGIIQNQIEIEEIKHVQINQNFPKVTIVPKAIIKKTTGNQVSS